MQNFWWCLLYNFNSTLENLYFSTHFKSFVLFFFLSWKKVIRIALRFLLTFPKQVNLSLKSLSLSGFFPWELWGMSNSFICWLIRDYILDILNLMIWNSDSCSNPPENFVLLCFGLQSIWLDSGWMLWPNFYSL